ncbi:TetR/AcrR family transcriptional regulator [Burkholderia cepacia]|uniref:TetR/AcrR family transcriptional regulator n=1 Tax=Burkholderia cepacia TaxID=292 RepID=UPI001E2843B4|nr:TetR/AcrR family transcriptional regulator [Burkholderia cepacia]
MGSEEWTWTEVLIVVVEQHTRGQRASRAAPTGAYPERLRAQGNRTRNTIIRVARKLLLESGTLDFSQRSVAQHAGISVSNLQYYFPTRLSVLLAVMDSEVKAYLNELTFALKDSVPPRQVLATLLNRVLQHFRDIRGTTLWLQFLSLASINPECAQLVEKWYDSLMRAIAELVRAVNPGSAVTDSERTAALLVAMADGLALQASIGQKRLGPDADAAFVEAAYILVEGGAQSCKRR